MSKIPLVKQEVVDIIARDLELQYNDIKKKGESVNHLIDFWRDFKKEQPALSALLLKELQGARGVAEKGYIAHGAWIIFKALKVQEEVDELNEAWGD